MHRFSVILLVALLFATGTPSLQAQQQKVLSPRDSVFFSLDTNRISVNYGRPSMRGRKIMGELVAWNQVWRTGANEATRLTTNFDMTTGGVPVPKGTFTLWTLPSPTGWMIILNKQTGQWGTKYDDKQDLARFDAKVEQLKTPVEMFTISLEGTGKTAGVLKLAWENTLVSTTFEKNDKIRPLSPNDSVETLLAGKKVAIKYSRPFMRGRKIWGVVVPMDSIWRTGANLATALVTDGDISIGETVVPRGSYTIYSLPTEKNYLLIISKKAGGSAAYDAKDDFARIGMKMEKSEHPIDQFRIWFESKNNNSALLRLGWDDRTYSVEVTAK